MDVLQEKAGTDNIVNVAGPTETPAYPTINYSVFWDII
jgi:hypothetical protein